MSKKKIIGLSYGDPWQPSTWSNNTYYLFSNLKEMGHLDFAWGEYPQKLHNNIARLWTGIRYSTFNLSEIGHLAPRLYISRIMNKKFRKILESENPSYALNERVVLSTSSFVTFDDLRYPVFLYGDQNFYQLFHGNPEIKQKISQRVF